MSINNNAISNSGFGIIYIGDRTIVSNNQITNIQQDGINANNYADQSIISSNVTISNNTITSPALAGGGRGGISVKNLVNSSIDHNTIRKCGPAFSVRFNGSCDNLAISQNDLGDGILQSGNTAYDKRILVTNNTVSKTYFPTAYPLISEFKLNVSSNTYTSDTTYNTAPDDYGTYSELNTFNIRTAYYLAAGNVKSIVPSWKGRTIQLKSTNNFLITQGNDINLLNGTSVSVPQNNNISFQFDGAIWNEVARTF